MPSKNETDKNKIKETLLEYYHFLLDKGFCISFYDDNYGYLGRGLCLGLENKNVGIRVMFVKETEVPQIEILIGTLFAPFDNPYARATRLRYKGWFRLLSLMEFLLKQSFYSRKEYETLHLLEFQHLISERIRSYISVIFDSLKDERSIGTWINRYFDFIEQRFAG